MRIVRLPGAPGGARRPAPGPHLRGRGANPVRILTTVLFTDIVGSTERAAQLGDRGWKDLVARHHAVVRRELRRFEGRELDTAGDGFFAIFDRPSQAIECATEIIDRLRPLDLHIRAAIHTGEAEAMGGKVGGITVHVASRALGQAEADEILVTSTVREVAGGADVTFSDRGAHEFKGIPGEWRLYAVEWQRREIAVAWPGETGVEAAARRRPGWRVAGAMALLGAGLTAVAAYLLLGPGTAAPPPVPQPNSAVRFDAARLVRDPATAAVVDLAPAGDTPTGIGIDAETETVWVLSLGDAMVTEVPLGGGTSRPIELPGRPTGIAAGGGSVWITFGYGATGMPAGAVLRISAGTGERDRSLIATAYGASAIALDQSVWVANGIADTVTRIDPETQGVVKNVSVAKGPVAVAVGEGSVWIAHAAGRAVWRLDLQTLSRTSAIPLTQTEPPTALAIGLGRVWVTSEVGNSVIVIDATTNERVDTIPLPQGPRGIAVGADAVWVAGAENALVRIDPGSLTVLGVVPLPGPAWGVAVSGDSVWVTVQQ